MKNETWKWIYINGEKTAYQISYFGRCKCFKKSKWHFKKHYINRKGYVVFGLSHRGKLYTKKVHRLVATAFKKNTKNLPQVNHKDGNKLNNKASNLEWCTSSHNVKHSLRLGLKIPMIGKDHPNSKRIGKYQNGILLKEYVSVSDTRTDGFVPVNVYKAVQAGHRSKKFYWKYV